MNKTRFFAVCTMLILLLAMATSALADAGSGSRLFTTLLRGADEVPPVPTKAIGKVSFLLSEDGQSMVYRLGVQNLHNPVAAHIHLGAAGVNGPVVVSLFSGPAGAGEVSGVIAEGKITAANFTGPLAGMPFSALVDAILAGNAYVNVHTNDGIAPTNTGPGDMASGEIRGQLH